MSDSESETNKGVFDMKTYMRKYIKNAKDVHCPYCGSTYKSYRKYRHEQSKKHQKNVKEGRLVMPVVSTEVPTRPSWENDVMVKMQKELAELKAMLNK